MTYLRDGHDESYYELGRWSLSRDAPTMTLDGTREENTYWTVKDARTLRKLDREGNPIDPRLSYELTRAVGVAPVEPRAAPRPAPSCW